jgi:glycosyltransferase involved in cell wall biosynthesis
VREVNPLSICVNTQTPLVQLLRPDDGGPEDWAAWEVPDLATLREGTDFRFSPGGVTRMVYPLVRRLLREGFLREAHWVSLNPRAPPEMHFGATTLHSIALEEGRMAGYGRVKEAIWGRVHETDPGEPHDDLFWSEAFSEYHYYNRITSELIRELDAKHDFDVFYVHDFQQMPVGHMLDTLKPKVFRWHIPFDIDSIPEAWRAQLKNYLDSYDVVIVSTDRYANSLEALHPKGKVVRMYPYIDPGDYSRPGPDEVAETATRLGLAPKDDIALVVARMDPIKGQDLAIRALATLAKEFPKLKLVLVGNGSFSSSKGGVGLSKSARWRTHLEQMVRTAGLTDRVVFTGHLGQADLDRLYERSLFTLLPSVREGFGLVTVESWVHDRPTIVTDRAGVADLVRDGVQALRFDPDDPEGLAQAMRRLLGDGSGPLRAKLVRNGRAAARKCSLEAAVEAERTMLLEATEA